MIKPVCVYCNQEFRKDDEIVYFDREDLLHDYCVLDYLEEKYSGRREDVTYEQAVKIENCEDW